MPRIVAGTAGGRRLGTPAGSHTRPTSERVREALFAKLDHDIGLAGARVLDLYAGSGALGLEAASRGAARVLLVESRPPVARVARDNARRLGLAGVEVLVEPVERLVAGTPPAPAFGLVLADPPYDLAEDRLAAVLAGLATPGWLTPNAIVVVERPRRGPSPAWAVPLAGYDERTYGDTRLWFGRVADPTDSSAGGPAGAPVTAWSRTKAPGRGPTAST